MMNIFKDFLLQLAIIATLVFTFHLFFAERLGKNHFKRVIQTLLFALSILLCMSYPASINNHFSLDIRIVPLLLGTLYSGMGTGILLAAIIILYRLYLRIDLGLYTTILTLVISMPVFVIFQKLYIKANMVKRITIALLLSGLYCLVGITSTYLVGKLSFNIFKAELLHSMITLAVVFFFVSLDEIIKETLKKNQQLQSKVKDAEIAFLRSQINPHFYIML
ncbi:hypothetical protein M5X11_12115 [Paenibacillus alginolyticus]|uniref:LytS/YhcK type 5TM receptor domain-containing protein n=1 Tax=Paenibacillus alginolyticus TaxID=59839 RepID=UPI0004041430|nr:LytS/YhcK type 5TM receptor domain-containing protein [Paenibacillus alginolyticus]MCY9665700.1 hypothetical protein [Paenibacillus alginolyticus]